MVIEIILFCNGKRQDWAEAEDEGGALLAGRTLYDEGHSGCYGQKLKVGFYVAGKLVRMVEGRP